MSKRFENRPVRVEKDLEVQVFTCDECGKELATSRDIYFGDERLVVEGEDQPWLRLGVVDTRRHDYPQSEPFDFCSRRCLITWAQQNDPIKAKEAAKA